MIQPLLFEKKTLAWRDDTVLKMALSVERCSEDNKSYRKKAKSLEKVRSWKVLEIIWLLRR
jgi:hypothetical protein